VYKDSRSFACDAFIAAFRAAALTEAEKEEEEEEEEEEDDRAEEEDDEEEEEEDEGFNRLFDAKYAKHSWKNSIVSDTNSMKS